MRSATCEGLADSNGVPSPQLHSMIISLAHGEVGLIVPGFVSSSKTGIAVPGQAGFYTDSLAALWRPTAIPVLEDETNWGNLNVHKTTKKLSGFKCVACGEEDLLHAKSEYFHW
jgi:hypothetical protein